MKNFYTCNNFFKLLIKAQVITLIIYITRYKTITIFCTQLLKLDQLAYIQKMDILCFFFTIESI